MYVSRLRLSHFRNYTELDLSLSPGLNIIYGNNAQGKTNLLEAVYFLATSRSHRTARDSELLQYESQQLRVQAAITRATGELSLDLEYGIDSKKRIRINNIVEKRIVQVIGSLAVVLFSPDDLQLVKGAPSGRRRFLDIELSQVSQTYLHHLISYNKVLAQRNAILKSPQPDRDLIEVYEQQLAENGSQIIHRRVHAVASLSALAARYHRLMSEDREHLQIAYQSSLCAELAVATPVQIAEAMHLEFARRRQEEWRRQATLVGPHRDDLSFTINGQDARLFASQGQQRTVVLALKLAELMYMHEKIGEPPVLLLDDVASELDPQRRHYLLSAVQEGIQTFISCTDLSDLQVRQWPTNHALFHVHTGVVRRDERGLT